MRPMAQSDGRGERAYVRAANAIRADIAAGRLKPGDKLPSIRDLASRHRVAEVTARNALRLLTDEGVAYVDTTRGYFVAEPSPAHRVPDPGADFAALAGQLDSMGRELEQLNDRLTRVEEMIQHHEPVSGGQAPGRKWPTGAKSDAPAGHGDTAVSPSSDVASNKPTGKRRAGRQTAAGPRQPRTSAS